MTHARNTSLRDRRVLVIGVGAYGGGASTALWLADQGAVVTVVDTRSADRLETGLSMLRDHETIKVHLGPLDTRDARDQDLVIPYPGMPETDPFLSAAIRSGAQLTTETNLFLEHVSNPLIAVTGTRGKTTVTNWIAHLLRQRYPALTPAGNTPGHALLAELAKQTSPHDPMVLELSSWQLDHAHEAHRSPHIAVITNIYRDHQNAYPNMEAYVRAKMHIFAHQRTDDYLILHHDSPWKAFIQSGHPQSTIYWFSRTALPPAEQGVFLERDTVVWREGGRDTALGALPPRFRERGEHNIDNVLVAIAACRLFSATIAFSEEALNSLPDITMRQQCVADRGGVTIINDATSTTPDALAAAIRRFAGRTRTVFIVGGTDKDLDYTAVAQLIADRIPPHDLILHPGSGTHKLVDALLALGYSLEGAAQCTSLGACVIEGLERITSTGGALVFSPGGSSFEHFHNEFHRGRVFNELISEHLRSS